METRAYELEKRLEDPVFMSRAAAGAVASAVRGAQNSQKGVEEVWEQESRPQTGLSMHRTPNMRISEYENMRIAKTENIAAGTGIDGLYLCLILTIASSVVGCCRKEGNRY